jgi:hypothetical protein
MKYPLPVSLCMTAVVIVLLLAAGCMTAPHTPTGTASANVTNPAVNATVTAVPVTTVAAPTPTAMFPGALALKENFPFGTGDVASEATVYRYWLNDTYQWLNDMDNKYYTQSPPNGDRYLFVFVSIVDKGNTRVWPPSANSIHLWYAGKEYALDPDHFLPDTVDNPHDKPIEIEELQNDHQLYSTELVSDYGYSHGEELGFVYPGESNALDGYLIYVVPASLTPDLAYVQIPFNGNDTGVWKLA